MRFKPQFPQARPILACRATTGSADASPGARVHDAPPALREAAEFVRRAEEEFRVHGIVRPIAHFLPRHEAAPAQLLQMLGNGRLADAQLSRQGSHAQVSLQKKTQNPGAGPVGQGSEHICLKF